MHNTIKHFIILILIFFASWYLHIKYDMLSIEYGSYKISISCGVIFFILLYLFFFLCIIRSILCYIILFPKKLYNKYHATKYEHGIISIIAALIGVLSENIVSTKIFYNKAKNILGDVPEILFIKAYINMMMEEKDIAKSGFLNLLNYPETRLLAIKILKNKFDFVEIDNVIIAADKSFPKIYKPIWLKKMVVDIMMKNEEWHNVVSYIDLIKANDQDLLYKKAFCFYKIGNEFFIKKEYKKAIHFFEKAINFIIDDEILIQYSRILYFSDNKQLAKDILLKNYKERKSSIFLNEMISFLKSENITNDELFIFLNSMLCLNKNNIFLNIYIIKYLIQERRYSEVDTYLQNIKDNSCKTIIMLLNLKISLLSDGYKSDNHYLYLDSIIDEEKKKFVLFKPIKYFDIPPVYIIN